MLLASYWDRFTSFLRSVLNNGIDHESLKKYLYQRQDDNNKAVLDIIVGGSYGECSYAEIAEKFEKFPKTTRLGELHRCQGNQGRNYGITTEMVNMFKMETTTMTTTSTRVSMVTEMIKMGLMFHLKIGKFLLEMVEVVWRKLRTFSKRDEEV